MYVLLFCFLMLLYALGCAPVGSYNNESSVSYSDAHVGRVCAAFEREHALVCACHISSWSVTQM